MAETGVRRQGRVRGWVREGQGTVKPARSDWDWGAARAGRQKPMCGRRRCGEEFAG